MIDVRVIGVGSPDGGDDRAGLEAAAHLRQHLLGLDVRERAGDMTALVEDFAGARRVIVLDAMWSHGAPGSIRRFDAASTPLPGDFAHASSHAWGLSEAVELARALDGLPPELIVYGIEGRDFTPGHPLTPEVAAALDEVVLRVSEEVVQPWASSRRD